MKPKPLSIVGDYTLQLRTQWDWWAVSQILSTGIGVKRISFRIADPSAGCSMSPFPLLSNACPMNH
jgi:hypothetical protein